MARPLASGCTLMWLGLWLLIIFDVARPSGQCYYSNGSALWPCVRFTWLGLYGLCVIGDGSALVMALHFTYVLGLVWPAFYLEGAARDMTCLYQRWRGLYGPAVPCYDNYFINPRRVKLREPC